LGAQPAIVDGAVGMVWVVGGRPKVVWDFTFENGKVVHIDMLASLDRLRGLDLTVLE
jgi:RNA polymerase sigma-70 factor (ECF subfamily)